jgi:hypothetical protein
MWSTFKKLGANTLRVSTKTQLRALIVFFGGTSMWLALLSESICGMILGFAAMILAFCL